MSEQNPTIPDHTVDVPAQILSKIERELRKEATDWSKAEAFMQSANVAPAAGYRLVVPADYPGKSTVLAFRPPWAQLDAPGSKVRVVKQS